MTAKKKAANNTPPPPKENQKLQSQAWTREGTRALSPAFIPAVSGIKLNLH